MVSENSKRIVVIKDIGSNYIEQAILILKNEPEDTVGKNAKDVTRKRNKKEYDFILKEAELIINNYIRQNKIQSMSRMEAKVKKRYSNKFINIALIGSIALLIFIASKFF